MRTGTLWMTTLLSACFALACGGGEDAADPTTTPPTASGPAAQGDAPADTTEPSAEQPADPSDEQPAETPEVREPTTLELGMDVGDIDGNVRVFMTDAPGDYDAVWVSITDVSVHFTGADDAEWLTLVDEPQLLNLLDLQDDVTTAMGDQLLAPGHYDQLRLIVDEAWVEQDGEERTLTIPSASQSGIKINLNLEVVEGEIYALVLDFDANESIHEAGDQLLMRPVVRTEYIGAVQADGTMETVQEQAQDGRPDDAGEPSNDDADADDDDAEAPAGERPDDAGEPSDDDADDDAEAPAGERPDDAGEPSDDDADDDADEPADDDAEGDGPAAPGVGNNLDTDEVQGNLRVFMTDAPGDYDAVWVSVTRVEVNRVADEEGGWITLVDTPQRLDLLQLQNDVSAALGDAGLEPGTYAQLRLIVEDASVEQDGELIPLTIPSASQSGIKINFNFTIEPETTYAVVLDFDAGRSIHTTGNGTLMMRPVLKIEYFAEVAEDGTQTPIFHDAGEAADDDDDAGEPADDAGEQPDDAGDDDAGDDDDAAGEPADDAAGEPADDAGEPADDAGEPADDAGEPAEAPQENAAEPEPEPACDPELDAACEPEGEGPADAPQPGHN